MIIFNHCDLINYLQGRAARAIIEKLTEGTRDDKIEALKSLSMKCTDATFAHEFINKNGLKLIIDYVIAGSKSL